MAGEGNIDWTEYAERPRRFGGLPVGSWLLYRTVWWLWWAVDRVFFRTRTSGLENVPADGPLLLLGNHVGLLDPFWVGLPIWRPSRFMAATTALRIPVIGPLIAGLGAFPKMKGVKDRQSMATLSEHLDAGLVVTLFPEGERSWDGRLGTVLPGTGRLVHRTGVPVLFARISNGYLLNPRWARYPRWLPLRIEYEGPHTYPPDWSPEQITEDIARRLHVEQRLGGRGPSWGFRLAAGLETLLWACPVCGAHGALTVPSSDQNRLTCRACGARWRVDLAAVLHGEDGAPTLSVAEAVDALVERFGDPPVFDRQTFESEGVVGQAPDATVMQLVGRRSKVEVSRGALRLRPDGLDVMGAVGSGWSVQFVDVLGISHDVGDQVVVRVASDHPRGDVYQVVVHGESPLKWSQALRAWHREARS